MFYLLVAFAIVFQMAVTLAAPYMPGMTVTGGDIVSGSVNTTADMMSAGVNPFETFGDLMTFNIEGAEAFSVIFILLDIVCLAIPFIKGIVRGG